MIKKFRANREILIPVVVSFLFFLVILNFKSGVVSLFNEKEINSVIVNLGIALTGFILTAYTIFLGFLAYLSKKISLTPIPEMIEKRFRLSIYLCILLLCVSIFYMFFEFSWIPPILISLTFLLILLLLRLISYLKLLFVDVRKNSITTP